MCVVITRFSISWGGDSDSVEEISLISADTQAEEETSASDEETAALAVDPDLVTENINDENPKETSGELTFDGKGYDVSVSYASEAALPEAVQLSVSEYDTQSEEYQERYEEAAALYNLEDEKVDIGIQLFNMSLYVSGDDGQMTEVEPAAPIQVEITYPEADEEDADDMDYTIIHFGEEIEKIQPNVSEDEEGEHLAFEVSGFSDIMVLATNEGEEDVQYVILDVGNLNGNWRDDSSSSNRHTGYWPYVPITGQYGAGDYSGNADDWRITAELPASDFEDGKLTITLPGDEDLPAENTARSTFYIYGDEQSNGVSVSLAKEQAYDYRLVGWINIGTGEYTSVRNGSAQVTINAEDDNIFYADWEAATYDVGQQDDHAENTVSTDFVTINMFDYNELFNLYSVENTLTGDALGKYSTTSGADSRKENWYIGDSFYTEPVGSSTREPLVGSFAFYDGKSVTDSTYFYLGYPDNRGAQQGTVGSTNTGDKVNISSHLGATTYDNSFFTDYLFNTNAEEDGVVGAHYVGTGDQLFKYGVEGDTIAEENGYVGYYYYDSRYNAANYNQSEGRFYVYDQPSKVEGCSYPEGFFPYNNYSDTLNYADGSVNYFFGMSMDVDFYLPNMVGRKNGNTVNGEDMTFNFSGDDDIWIFVDDILVLDMSGVHNKSYGSIDFCTGEVTLKTTDTEGNIVYTTTIDNIQGFNADVQKTADNDEPSGSMAAGEHTLRVYYLERGGNSSNMIVSFNVAPTWMYESDTAGMVSVDKVWQDASGNKLEGEETANCPDVTLGLYEKDPNGGEDTLISQVTLSYDENATYLDPETGVEIPSYGWHYTWELLDPEKVEAGDYIVKEISSSDYIIVQESQSETQYGCLYWTIVGETEIETWLYDNEDADTSTGEYPRYPVILTDAASDSSEGVTGKAVYIDTSSGNPKLSYKTIIFSRHPEEVTDDKTEGYEITTGIYGVIGATEVSDCDPSVIWYLEYAETPEGDSLDVFHICYEADDGNTYYLAVQYDVNDEESEPQLVLSTVKDQNMEDGYYDEFYCDELGEVRLYDLRYRLVLSSSDGSMRVGDIDQDHYEHNNIKLYTLTYMDDAPYYNYMVSNRLIEPKISKEIAEDDYERKEDSGEQMHNGEDTSGDGWGTWDDADNNQEVTYHLTLTDLLGVTNLTVHDYLEEGLDFEPDTVIIDLYDDGKDIVLRAEEDYKEKEGTCSDPQGCAMSGCTFEIEFEDSVFEEITDDAYIVITYKAVTNTHASDYNNYEDDILNHSYLTYGINSYRSDIVTTETDLFGFGVYKYTEEGDAEVALSGAKFVLEKSGQYAMFEPETTSANEDYYLVKGWTDDKDSAGVLTSGDDGMIRIEGLDDDSYTLTETEAPVGYELLENPSIVVVIDENGGVTFTGGEGVEEDETYTRVDVGNDLILIDINGSKTWVDSDDQDGERPGSITVHLYANGTEIDSTEVTATDNWSWSFTDLPKYENGKEIVYYVIEETVPDYTPNYTYEETDDGYNVNITNTHTPDETSLYVYKLWIDEENQDGIQPDEITIHLLADGVQAQDADGDDYVLILSEDNDWSGSFTGLPVYHDQGTEIEYTVSEDSVEGYVTNIVPVDNANVVIIDNTHEPETIDVEGTKTWDDGDDQDGLRPDYITIHLYANDEDIAHINVTEEDGWSWSFTGLPKYADGEEIVYTIGESAVDGYESTVDGYDITNTHTPETVDVEGTKTWDDSDNQDGKRPDSITIRLLADGEEIDSVTVTENDGWSWSFKDLPKYADGLEIAYAITEDVVEDYSTTYDGYDVTNSYTPGKTSLMVTKVWDDQGDADSIRPGEIMVKLLKNGEETGETLTLNAADNWIGTFTDLDEYTDGTKNEYTIEEMDVEGYVSVMTGDATSGYVITNTHTPPEKTVDTDGDGIFEDDGVQVQDGDELTYEIKYYNYKDEAATVTITDTLDYALDFVSASDDGKYDEDSRTIIWTIENAPAQAWGSVTFKATVNDIALLEEEIENTATVQIGNDKALNTNIVKNPTPDLQDEGQPGTTGTTGTTGRNGGTKTGDTNNIGLWLVLLVAGLACVVAAIRMRKRS